MGEMEIGRCEICGEESVPLNRIYYRFPNIKCACHSPCHFILIRYCDKCTPHPPRETKVTFSYKQLEELNNLLEQ